MLTIRQEQLNTIQNSSWRAFEKKALIYLRKAVPDIDDRLDTDGQKSVIRQGIQKASQYPNAKSEKEICKIIELMVIYGIDFDTNEDLPFRERIVQERMVYEREPLIDALYELKDKIPLTEP